MAIIPPDAEEMDSLYSEEASPAKPSTDMEEEAGEEMEEGEGSESGTAVISNSVLSPGGQPLKAGDRVILEVVKTYGDESEVRYASSEAAAVPPPPMGGMAGAEAELDQMDTA